MPVFAQEKGTGIGSLISGALEGKETGLPLPRFVTLKSKRTNMRIGPSFDHRISWVYVRSGVPVEVIQEFEVWRLVRDSDDQEGWVHKALLSSKRVALIAPGANDEYVNLVKSPLDQAPTVAKLQSGVFADIVKCEDQWCALKGNNYQGWARSKDLYGVYRDETVK